ncbi:hypothetical protein PCL_06200 [Purpureocillium lilacinum]|uniref:Uncharacterized protein n=1 Tax=Purpureocillium lilacinum TaxID=33203 RepID=A0A2U3EM39_PURLI|nr:hypothetical protein PCL_06200 [Purpureocillium lilacinum]
MGQDPKTQRVRALGKGSSRHLGLPAKGLPRRYLLHSGDARRHRGTLLASGTLPVADRRALHGFTGGKCGPEAPAASTAWAPSPFWVPPLKLQLSEWPLKVEEFNGPPRPGTGADAWMGRDINLRPAVAVSTGNLRHSDAWQASIGTAEARSEIVPPAAASDCPRCTRHSTVDGPLGAGGTYLARVTEPPAPNHGPLASTGGLGRQHSTLAPPRPMDPPIPHQSAVASTYQSVHSALSSSRPFDDTQAIASSTRRSSTAAQPRRPRSTQRRPEESLAARSPTRATATRADRGAVVAAVACAYP